MRWLLENGGWVDATALSWPAATKLGRGVVAKRNVAPREAVVRVPSTLHLSAKSAPEELRTQVLDHIEHEDDSGEEPEAETIHTRELAVVMTDCVDRLADKCFWWPYLDALPKQMDLPDTWTFDEVMDLQDPGIESRAERNALERARVFRNLEALRGRTSLVATYKRETLDWAFLTIQTRAFGVDGYDTLIPMFDNFNHNSSSGRDILVSADSMAFVPGATAAGEEMWNTYGPKANEELLLYGFVESHNRNDFVRGTPTVAGRSAELTLRWPRESNPRLGILLGGVVPVDFLQTWAYLAMDSPDPLEFPSLAQSTRPWRTCARMMGEAHTFFGTTMEEDIAELHRGEFHHNAHRETISLVYRIGRKDLIRAHHDLCVALAHVQACSASWTRTSVMGSVLAANRGVSVGAFGSGLRMWRRVWLASRDALQMTWY